MVISHSYVSLPEGTWKKTAPMLSVQDFASDFPASGATTRCEDGLVGGTETSRRKLRFESKESEVVSVFHCGKSWQKSDDITLPQTVYHCYIYIYMAMSQNPGTVGTLNRWFMPVYSPRYGSNRFWPIPIYIYVYLYCSYTFPPDNKIYSVDQCIICTGIGICNIYIYILYTYIYDRTRVYIYIYDYIWDCIVDSLMDTGNRTWLMWFRLCSPKQTFKASWTRSTSCKHARLANLEQTLSNQVTQKYVDII